MYPPELVNPMKAELADKGFSSLESVEAVDAAIAQKGATLIVLNSVCGCAAGSMRPAVLASLDHSKLPGQLATSFAGVDKDAVERVRKHTLPYPPSSPSVALFVDGKLAHMVERHHIEGNTADALADHLKAVYDQYC
ncbi:MAG: BrxA/BrxB family bacilliredoxin [Flavobacteriales bacterium]|nr:BrxA/BrxB family bacilliredoxin [Flavobacteriales bacterium]